MNIHENIKKLREEQHLTLEEVGKRTGTTKQTIKRYEDGEISNIPYDRILSLAKCFSVSPGYLMGWEPKTTEQIANIDFELTNMDQRIKAYALKMNELSKENQEFIMQMIDKLEK